MGRREKGGGRRKKDGEEREGWGERRVGREKGGEREKRSVYLHGKHWHLLLSEVGTSPQRQLCTWSHT